MTSNNRFNVKQSSAVLTLLVRVHNSCSPSGPDKKRYIHSFLTFIAWNSQRICYLDDVVRSQCLWRSRSKIHNLRSKIHSTRSIFQTKQNEIKMIIKDGLLNLYYNSEYLNVIGLLMVVMRELHVSACEV